MHVTIRGSPDNVKSAVTAIRDISGDAGYPLDAHTDESMPTTTRPEEGRAEGELAARYSHHQLSPREILETVLEGAMIRGSRQHVRHILQCLGADEATEPADEPQAEGIPASLNPARGRPTHMESR